MLLLNYIQRRNFNDACEDALLKLAEDGNEAAIKVVENPRQMRRVIFRLSRNKTIINDLGDGKLLEKFEKLVEFLLEHSDEILAVVMKIISLFVEKPKGS
jgi:hypothetical protein